MTVTQRDLRITYEIDTWEGVVRQYNKQLEKYEEELRMLHTACEDSKKDLGNSYRADEYKAVCDTFEGVMCQIDNVRQCITELKYRIQEREQHIRSLMNQLGRDKFAEARAKLVSIKEKGKQ